MNPVEQALTKLKLKFRLSGNNYQINCPFCSDTKQRLGIHKDTGKWKCFNGGCNYRGSNIAQFQYGLKKLKKNELQKSQKISTPKKISVTENDVSKFHAKLMKGSKALDYARLSRGFSDKAIKHFKLGVRKKFKNKSGENYKAGSHLVLPYYDNGVLVNCKYRKIKLKDGDLKWRREKGGKSVLFNNQVLKNLKYDSIYIAESEIDAMSIWDSGIKNVVGLTTGAEGFQPEWFDQVQRFKKIYLVLDNDEVGQAAARKLAERLGMDRCYNVVIPKKYKDPNEYFWNGEKNKRRKTKEDFQNLVQKSELFSLEDVSNADAMLNLVKDNIKNASSERNDGILSPWENVNELMGSSKPGHFVVIAGRAKVGKSSYALNWMMTLANSNVSSLYYSCEMNADSMGRNLVRMSDPTYTTFDDINKRQILSTQLRLKTHNLNFIFPKLGEFNVDDVCAKMEMAVKRYGCKVIFFDNLLFLARADGKMDVKDKVGLITQRFKLLAEKLGIVFVLLTHPRKTNHNRALSMDDLKESSSIAQDLDNLILVHREFTEEEVADDNDPLDGSSNNAMSELMEVRVVSRWAKGGRCHLYFNGHRGLLSCTGEDYNNLLDKKMSELKRKQKMRERKRRQS